MLIINRQTDYAIRVTMYLAMQSPGTRFSARELGLRRVILSAIARRVVVQLAEVGLLKV